MLKRSARSSQSNHHRELRPDGETRAARAPYADALLRATAAAAGSVHALPLSGGHSVAESPLRERFIALLGENYLAAEVSYSGHALDSFFRPKSALAHARRLAARAFGADATFFVTCGTTVGNRMAIEALVASTGVRNRPVRVLADRTSHQSVHFTLDSIGAAVTYGGRRGDDHGREWPDVEDLVDRHRRAACSAAPFDVVVLSAGGYDGAMVDVHAVLVELLRHSDDLTVLVDEAWSAILSFHPQTSAHTALAAAHRVRAEHPGKRLRMIVTHSAHKSMSALRQGSYLHVLGDGELVGHAEKGLYRNHTTSPSLPVLASLDLARAQAELEGAGLVARCLHHADELRRVVRDEPELAAFAVAEPAGADDPWILADPTKVLLLADPGLIGADELRLRLVRDHGLYLARTTANGVLLHLHIGVTREVFDHLLDALRAIAAAGAPPPAARCDGQFLIAYPPGIPVVVPGESTSPPSIERLAELRASGAELFHI